MDGLNSEQKRAVEAPDGSVMIVAGPGTGKTKTLTARIVYLVRERKIAPKNILALTFTKKASEEMRERVVAALPDAPKITTFHALCYELLGGDAAFITETDRLALIKSLVRPSTLKHISIRELGLLISRAKNQPPDYPIEPALQKVVADYSAKLRQQVVSDFDDLLLRTYELLRHDASKREAVQQQYQYILVDEFQDTNMLQYELLRLLCSTRNMFVIGDPNQSIYGFRGASGDIFNRFLDDHPGASKITLYVNYRSTPEIVGLANVVFSAKKPLNARPGRNGQARAVLTLNEHSETNWVLDEIQRAIGGGDFLRAVSDDERAHHRRLSDFAVLYRSRSCAMVLHKAFAASGLPYQIVGDGSPYEKPFVQNIIALLKALVSGDDVSVKSLTETQCRTLLSRVDIAQPPAKVAGSVAKVFGFGPSPDLTQLTNLLLRFDHLKQALAYIDQIAEGHFYDPNADAVTLLTIHASKGLEFPCVFLIGAQEGILPHEKADEQEERRLFYVAVTRAKEYLDILHTKFRGGELAVKSRFVAGLPESTLPSLTDPKLANDERRAHKRKMKRSQQSLF